MKKDMKSSYLFIFASIIALTFTLKVFLVFNSPIGFNEGAIATLAKEINNRALLYVDYFDHKPFLFHYSLSFIFKLFGTSIYVPHLAYLAIDLLLLLTVFIVARNIYNTKVAIIAASLYYVLVIDVNYDSELLMAFFGLVGVHFYYKSTKKSKNFMYLALSGIFIALSTWTKQPGFLFFISIFIHQTLLFFKKSIKKERLFLNLYLIISGMVFASLPLASFFIYKFGFDNMIFSLITFNLKFIGSTSRILQIGKLFWIYLFYFGIPLSLFLYYAKDVLRMDYTYKTSLFLIILIVSTTFFALNREIFYNHVYQIVPFVVLLSVSPFYYEINDDIKRIIVYIIVTFMLILLFQNLEVISRNQREGLVSQQLEVADFLNRTIPKTASFFSDSPQYYFVSGLSPNSRYFLLAPSFSSVFNYSFLCNNSKSKTDFMLLTARKKYLSNETLSCIESQFKLIKKFEETGESYVEVWQNKKKN